MRQDAGKFELRKVEVVTFEEFSEFQKSIEEDKMQSRE
jgi:hypothetical protein